MKRVNRQERRVEIDSKEEWKGKKRGLTRIRRKRERDGMEKGRNEEGKWTRTKRVN